MRFPCGHDLEELERGGLFFAGCVWCYPQLGSASPDGLEFNFDGTAYGNPRLAGVGGIIRNDVGLTVLSFSGPTGTFSSNEAELLALRTSHRDAHRLYLIKLIIEGDSCAIPWGYGIAKAPRKLAAVADEISDLVRSLQVSSHINRNANTEAVCHAKGQVSCRQLLLNVFHL